MKKPAPLVFLLDVDNTLLNNDRITAELKEHLSETIGRDCEARYWEIFEELRKELGYADYLGALQRYREIGPADDDFQTASLFLLDYPFADRLFPGALDVIKHLDQFGTTVILTDGDVVFQPWKIKRSGLYDAVGGRVMIQVHKEKELHCVESRFPAEHYVLIDDKLRILSAVKDVWGSKLTTVFPRQGHYAFDPAVIAAYPAADITVESIGELVGWSASRGVME